MGICKRDIRAPEKNLTKIKEYLEEQKRYVKENPEVKEDDPNVDIDVLKLLFLMIEDPSNKFFTKCICAEVHDSFE